jgi:hypothetical protein
MNVNTNILFFIFETEKLSGYVIMFSLIIFTFYFLVHVI